jgi:trimeric autotransporter adhesin
MSRQTINIGTTANDGTGDPLRTAFDKINDNFVELYGADNNLNTLDANLDVNNYVITTGVTNGNITITPNGTGNINLGSITINGSTISSNDSTQITVAENIQTTGTLNVDGTATIGGATTLSTSLALASGATVSEFSTDGTMAGNSNTAVPTENAVKTYVDSQVTAQDLDFTADDSTTNSIDLDSEVLEFKGGTGITTSAINNQVNINIDSTVATLTGSQTLTNKILTAPTINGATMTGSVSIDNITINDTDITTSSNANLTLNPGGTGTIQLSANTAITGTASVSGTLTTADVTTVGNQTISGNLSTGGDLTVGGSIIADTLTFASNGDITIDPAGTGAIILTGDVTHTGTHTTTGDLQVDNININSNTISSTNTNGGINITPNGTGVITLGGNYVAVTNELAANDVAVGSELLLGSGAEIVAVTTNDDLTLRTNGTGTIQIQNPQTQMTVGAGAGANALPGDPVGYLKIKLGASTYVIPYWNQA